MRSKICMSSYAIVILIWLYWMEVAASDPQLNYLGRGCNPYNVTSLSTFPSKLNTTYRDLRTKLNNGSLFATAQQTRGPDPVYALIQCRNYMSKADCLTCFNEATVHLTSNCPGAIGARVIYDGCFLRYEGNDRFFVEGTTDANNAICNNRTTSTPNATFEPAVQKMLTDLADAAWKTKDLYAATKRKVDGSANATVYGIAQCVQSIPPSKCDACLRVGVSNLQTCSNSIGRALDSGCFVRYSDRPFFADNQTTNLKPFLRTKASSTKKALISGGVAASAALIVILALYLYYREVSKKKNNPRGDILGATELRGPTNYSYKDLKSATENFKEANKLGQGGFGGVYKGTLKNGKIVAVKKLSVGQSTKAKADFKSEVTLISNVHHRNLVRLLGCCNKGPELLLVYEYMANKSLDRFLFGKEGRTLNWKQRFDIILGTAQGLAYLHEQFHACIIHRDIKSSNILLDDNFQPKIADFGLARLMPESKSHVSTKVAGTLGYTAPEYAIRGQLSEKVDAYSYGVVVLEVISGKKCNEMLVDPGAEYLLKRAWNLYDIGKHLELVDQKLDPNEFEAEDVEKVIKIALKCTQSSPSLRPTMSEVVVMLKSKSSVEEKPLSRPPFIELEAKNQVHTISTSIASSNSNAEVTITQLSGR